MRQRVNYAAAFRLCGVILFIRACCGEAVADESISLSVAPTDEQCFQVSYDVTISGHISTPNAEGVQHFPLTSTGEFRFAQKQSASDGAGPFSVVAVRHFEVARTSTTVGKDHKTSVALPYFYRTIHAYGSDSGLLQLCPKYTLPRKQVDLIQMPFDVLAVQQLASATNVTAGDKWNAAAWVTSMLTGVDAVVEQSITCQLKSLSATEAVVAFEGAVDGAVQGSATEVTFRGTLTVDRAGGFIKSLAATQNEKRSPGPVSPGLDVVAQISWTQQQKPDVQIPGSPPSADPPSEQSLQLLLQTPLRLQLNHSREWHLFHETPSVLMMRQLRDGSLISQCNISSAVTVPPGQHTPDSEFLADVRQSVDERKGTVTGAETVRDDDAWRIRCVRATGNAGGHSVQWDYYLCTAASGEQFSIVFSYSQVDKARFGEEAGRLLSTLRIARKRPALPYQ